MKKKVRGYLYRKGNILIKEETLIIVITVYNKKVYSRVYIFNVYLRNVFIEEGKVSIKKNTV